MTPRYPDADALADIQGLVYNAWTDHPYAAFLFVQLGPDPARGRAWLAELAPHVTPAASHRRAPHGRVQLALSPSGLAALGVPGDVVGGFAQEATQGMHARARILGDDPQETWELGGEGDRLDAIVMIYARTAGARAERVTEQRAALAAAGAQVRAEELETPIGTREHFGFADGLSQPFVPSARAPTGPDAVSAGEILLGYPNEYGALPHSPAWDGFDLGHNGTYLVFRKLAQHVERLWGYLADQARADPTLPGDVDARTELLAAKMVGRWRSGAPLVLAPTHDEPRLARPEHVNAFEYQSVDPHGLRCPISAHVRRANPRDARGGSPEESRMVVARHRILRRGRPYGPPLPLAQAKAGEGDGAARGLYFIALQASIARGFEFIQQTWLSSPGFHGLHGEPDPIMGNSAGDCPFTIPDTPLRRRLHAVPVVVTVRGGGYFFLPAVKAIARIARGPERG